VLVKYDAYGNIYNTSAGDLNLPFRFAGMRYEKDTDIYLTPNRAYSPAIGRWLQPDPLGTLPNPKQGNRFSPLSQYTDGRNLYEYCAGDPINERDLLGLKCNCNLAEKMLCRWEEVDFKLRNRSYWSLGLPFGIGDNLALVYRHGVAIDKCVWREKVCKERIIWDSMRLEGVYRVWTEFWPPVFVFFSDSIELPIRKVAEEIGGLV
jgi:RHS repeat-associated protein